MVSIAARSLQYQETTPSIWHAANVEPVTIKTLVGAITDAWNIAAPQKVVAYAHALERAETLGLSSRHVDLAAVTHSYDSRGLCELAARQSPSEIALSRHDKEWYRSTR